MCRTSHIAILLPGVRKGTWLLSSWYSHPKKQTVPHPALQVQTQNLIMPKEGKILKRKSPFGLLSSLLKVIGRC